MRFPLNSLPFAAIAVSLLLASCHNPLSAQTVFDLETATLAIDAHGVATLALADGTSCPKSGQAAFTLTTATRRLAPTACQFADGKLDLEYADGSKAQFAVAIGRGFAAFRLTKLVSREKVERFALFSQPLPKDAQIAGTLNSAYVGPHIVAVVAAEPNVHALNDQLEGPRGDRAGCSHQFTQSATAKAGRYAAKFDAACNEQAAGWSMRGKNLAQPTNLSGCRAIRAWVHGDGKGEALKIQLQDGVGGYRDDYIPIDFTGWKQVTLRYPALDTLKYDRVAALSLYYNGLPANTKVSCLVDQIEAVVERAGQEQTIVLEDFESIDSVWWNGLGLSVETCQGHGIEPAAFGVIACPRKEFLDVLERFQPAAGIPSPKPGGALNKRSPWTKRSYLFITSFRQSQFDDVLAMARRGGFDMILMGQESWTTGTGHYDINRDNFPEGLEGLKKTIRRFKDAGFHVGLHVLAASIYPPDSYITPIPDPRLVKGVKTTLAADVDAKATTLPIATTPQQFPADDGGYMGPGTVLQIGDELISYGGYSAKPPFVFNSCGRGHLGTKASAHRKGETVVHLVRSYGYHMYDMDTTLLDEVATNFAKVANACDIDMVYFDGSEALQGDHWYYNAKMHKAFLDKLARKDVLLQGSSFSHYSWHLMARCASADGHGDLKGYLDERSGAFDGLADDSMPLDVGWYYGYDPNCVIDMYEYVLGTTIGYQSSMSFQVSLDSARAHPFTGEILDLIHRYERLRLSGRVPQAMKDRLRIDPALRQVLKPDAPKDLVDKRRDYRLLGDEGHEVFQRVVYTPWQEFRSPADAKKTWRVEVKQGPAAVGFEVQAQEGGMREPGDAYNDPTAVALETFDTLQPYAASSGNGKPLQSLKTGEGGSTSPGVTMNLAVSAEDPRVGKHCLVYSATNPGQQNDGWSFVGKTFNPPLDLAWHKAIGFWMRGDGQGGAFKLQLTDGKGATDYYVQNDYVGWRYHQLLRPAKDPIDYKNVRTLGLYYNGLPAKKTVRCAIDDVKALRQVDTPLVRNPFVEINGKKIAWRGDVRPGQFLLYWPAESVSLYGLPLTKPMRQPVADAPIALPVGVYEVRFGCDGAWMTPARARVTLQPPEKHAIP
jgi:hypothetical protein